MIQNLSQKSVVHVFLMKACSLLVFCEQTTFSPLLNSRAQLLRASIIMPSQPAKSCATQEKSSLAEREGIRRFAHCRAKTQLPRKILEAAVFPSPFQPLSHLIQPAMG
jgi:hypothetical protein